MELLLDSDLYTEVINNELKSANEDVKKYYSLKLRVDEMSSLVSEDMVSMSSRKPKKKLKVTAAGIQEIEFRSGRMVTILKQISQST